MKDKNERRMHANSRPLNIFSDRSKPNFSLKRRSRGRKLEAISYRAVRCYYMGRIPDSNRRIPYGYQRIQPHLEASHMDVRPLGLIKQVPSSVSLNPCKHLPGVSLKTYERSPVIFGKLNTMHLQGLAPKRWTFFIAFRLNHREREVNGRESIFFVAFEIMYNDLGLRKPIEVSFCLHMARTVLRAIGIICSDRYFQGSRKTLGK